MPFNASNWGVISSSGSTQAITLQGGPVIGAPSIYTYQSATETIATISSPDYFAPVGNTVAVGDIIYILAEDGAAFYEVLAVDVATGNFIIAQFGGGSGNVTGPGASTNNALVRWNSTSGELIKNSTVILDDSGNLTGIASESIISGGAVNFSNAGNTFATSIKGGNAGANFTYTLPATAPAVNGSVLNSSTAGVMSWGLPAGVTQQAVYVAANGNDTTGNGSIIAPYLTIGHALSTITDSASTKPYVVFIMPGTYSETGLQIPVWVFLQGSTQQATKIIDTSGAITITSSAYNSGSQRLGFAELNLINSTGLTIDFQAIGGSGSNDIYLVNNQIVGPVTLRGRGSDFLTGYNNQMFGAYTSSSMQEIYFGGYFASSMTYNTLGVTSQTIAPELTGVDIFSDITFTSSGAGNAMEPTLISSQVSGTLTVDQATTNLFADEVSLNAATLTITNSGVITYLSVAKYEGYTPAIPGNWSPTPVQVAAALDQLAARPSGGSGITWNDQTTTPVTIAVSNGYVTDNAGLVTLNMPASVAFGSIFQIAGKGAGGWLLQMNTGQTIQLGNIASSSAGSLASTNQWDCVSILCVTANTTFVVTNSIGNITVA